MQVLVMAWQVCSGELPVERLGGVVVRPVKASRVRLSSDRLVKFVRRDDFLLDDGEEDLWFSQDAWTGVWIMMQSRG